VPVPALGPTPTGHVVGWLLPEGATDVRVTVAGEPRDVTTLDGLGLADVGLTDVLRVQATLAGGGTFDRTVAPRDAQRPLDPERYDLFPPGGPE